MFDLASSDILLDKEVVMESESVLLVEVVDVPSNFGSILPSHCLCIDANNRRRNIDEFEHELRRTILRVEENALLR
jgi:hypothetical protein